jgi:uncharacterized protein (TIGR02147 family)
MASIYAFLDYREFLRQDFAERKARNAKFSYRSLAKKLGINSGTIVRIMSGKRNLSRKMLPRLISFLKLKNQEARYLGLLVALDKSKTVQDQQAQYAEIVKLRGERKRSVGTDKHAYYQQWYYTAVRELLRLAGPRPDYDGLAAALIPAITPRQAALAVEELERLGFVERGADGGLRVKDSHITTGDKWQGVAVHAFQIAMLQKAIEAMEWFPKEDRDVSTVTVALSDSGLARSREIMRRAREEILDIEESDPKRDRVFQLNIQLFPLSKRLSGGKA